VNGWFFTGAVFATTGFECALVTDSATTGAIGATVDAITGALGATVGVDATMASDVMLKRLNMIPTSRASVPVPKANGLIGYGMVNFMLSVGTPVSTKNVIFLG
jgi:hypothetical protein